MNAPTFPVPNSPEAAAYFRDVMRINDRYSRLPNNERTHALELAAITRCRIRHGLTPTATTMPESV